MSKALYRKYRSKSLDTIVGQTHVTDVLSRSLKSGNTAHAYLFTGPRGVGKTSIARILAHEINNLPYADDSDHLDIIEIDAASNNGVDDVRDLREKALIAPAVAAKKVYIIDEVHMLSKSAFNALLKILEEPPEHVVFIMATTDFDKLPATIVSRTQRFHFRFVAEETVAKLLEDIAKNEKITLDANAAHLIAQQGGGSVRDSVSLLDQLQHIDGKITVEAITETLGLAPENNLHAIIDALKHHDAKVIVTQLDHLSRQGVSAATLAKQLAMRLRSELAKQPDFATKVEGLLDVGRSSHPDVRLLVILLDGLESIATTRPKTAAAAAYTPTQTIPLVAPTSRSQPTLTSPSTAHAHKESASKPAPPSETIQAPAKIEGETTYLTEEAFDWQKLLEHAHEKDGVIFTMLNKCTPEVSDGKLFLYAGKKFHKSRLDDPKYRLKISQFLQEIGTGDILIETVGTPPPPRDATLAKVAELMGGGEEVDA